MDKKEIEIRSVAGAPVVEGEGRHVEGYALLFGVESRVLCDWCADEPFVEVIERGAITKQLLRSSDVKCLYNHDRGRLLARADMGEGSLKLTLDDKGLKYAFDAPHTADGDMLVEQLGRGDIKGSSFAFSCDEGAGPAVRYSRGKDGMLRRTIIAISALYDVSPVVDPAYTQTSVTARAWDESAEIEGGKDKDREPETRHAYGMRLRLRKELMGL